VVCTVARAALRIEQEGAIGVMIDCIAVMRGTCATVVGWDT
jgi:hypothetical protein